MAFTEDETDLHGLFEAAERRGCGIYLLSPPELASDFADLLCAALEAADVAAFQLRLKGASDEEILRWADALLPLCRERGTAFLVNDRADLAAACGADGVHLGQADGDPREARRLLGPGAQIGVTCHASRHLAMEAGEAGADYVAFGAFFPSDTKQSGHRADPSILRWWSRLFELPCVAIGGIDAANARQLADAGADFVATCSFVWQHRAGPGAAIRELAEALG